MLGLGVAFAAVPFLGARLTSRFVSGPMLKRIFGILIVAMPAVTVATLLTS
jgi:hypothetical protein